MIPDPQSPEQAPQERRVPLVLDEWQSFDDWLREDGWYFDLPRRRPPIGEDMIDYERDLL